MTWSLEKRKPLMERLLSKVKKDYVTGCWVWQGAIRSTGYGVIHRGGPVSVPIGAHRASWELFNGPIPAGLWVLHQCDNPPCINPRHLYLGDCARNTQDAVLRRLKASGIQCRNAKLTVEAVAAIRASIEHQDILAERYGVSQQTISAVKIGKRYPHD